MANTNLMATKAEKTGRPIRSARVHERSHNSAITTLKNRTPEQIQEDRERILARSPKPQALPPGKTLEDIMVGQWPGDETEEEVMAALEELS